MSVYGIPYTVVSVAASVTMADVTTAATVEGTATTAPTATITKTVSSKQHMNLFDLANVGLSSTLAIAIFIGIGYVVRHVAGPSAIVSVVIAAVIAYLVGKFRKPQIAHVLNFKVTRTSHTIHRIVGVLFACSACFIDQITIELDKMLYMV